MSARTDADTTKKSKKRAEYQMSIGIRRCSSCLSDNSTTRGFVIEIELFGFLAELVLTKR